LQDAGVQVVAIDFPSNLHTMICYYQFGMQNQLLLLTSQDRVRINDAMAWPYYLFARFIPAVDTSPRAVCVTWLCSRLFHY
jgi:hypothetical protein